MRFETLQNISDRHAGFNSATRGDAPRSSLPEAVLSSGQTLIARSWPERLFDEPDELVA
jgi:hypothetical protein